MDGFLLSVSQNSIEEYTEMNCFPIQYKTGFRNSALSCLESPRTIRLLPLRAPTSAAWPTMGSHSLGAQLVATEECLQWREVAMDTSKYLFKRLLDKLSSDSVLALASSCSSSLAHSGSGFTNKTRCDSLPCVQSRTMSLTSRNRTLQCLRPCQN